MTQTVQYSTLLCFMLLWATPWVGALPSSPTSGMHDITSCVGQYKPALPVYQLNHGIEAARQFTGHGIQGCSSCSVTFYTTVLSLSWVAMTLNTATLNNSHNISVSTKQAALAAIVDQLVVDACNLGLSQLEGEDVNCTDMESVSDFALRQFQASATVADVPDRLTLTMAVIANNLLKGIEVRSEVSESGKDAWVRTLLPVSAREEICRYRETGLHCCL